MDLVPAESCQSALKQLKQDAKPLDVHSKISVSKFMLYIQILCFHGRWDRRQHVCQSASLFLLCKASVTTQPSVCPETGEHNIHNSTRAKHEPQCPVVWSSITGSTVFSIFHSHSDIHLNKVVLCQVSGISTDFIIAIVYAFGVSDTTTPTHFFFSPPQLSALYVPNSAICNQGENPFIHPGLQASNSLWWHFYFTLALFHLINLCIDHIHMAAILLLCHNL